MIFILLFNIKYIFILNYYIMADNITKTENVLSQKIANIILHVILISTLISIFFFTYAAKIEEKIVKEQVEHIISDLVGPVKMLSPNYQKVVKMAAQLLESPNMDDLDKKVADNNKKLLIKVSIMILILVIVGVFIIYKVSKTTRFGFDFKELMKHNAIILVFVLITEMAFITFIAKNHRMGDSNFVKKSVLIELKKHLK
jgi:hypothetical protein